MGRVWAERSFVARQSPASFAVKLLFALLEMRCNTCDVTDLLQVQGSGFLYKQVRHMTGAVLAVGEGRMGLQDISRRLEVGSNEAPGMFCRHPYLWLNFICI